MGLSSGRYGMDWVSMDEHGSVRTSEYYASELDLHVLSRITCFESISDAAQQIITLLSYEKSSGILIL